MNQDKPTRRGPLATNQRQQGHKEAVVVSFGPFIPFRTFGRSCCADYAAAPVDSVSYTCEAGVSNFVFDEEVISMILEQGDNVLVSHRRLFESDEARFFVGRTIACEDSLVKAEGYSFVRDLASGHIIKKEEKRTKVLSLVAPGQLVYQLPADIDVDAVDIASGNGDAMLVCGRRPIMNLSERTHCGHF